MTGKYHDCGPRIPAVKRWWGWTYPAPGIGSTYTCDCGRRWEWRANAQQQNVAGPYNDGPIYEWCPGWVETTEHTK